MRGTAVNEVGVTWQLGRLEYSEARADARLETAVRAIETTLDRALPNDYQSEVNLRLHYWLEGIAPSLQRGVILFIDYGLPRAQYYSVERTRGTLLCHYRHRFHDDVFANIGLQDIGAWGRFHFGCRGRDQLRLLSHRIHDAGAFSDRLRHRDSARRLGASGVAVARPDRTSSDGPHTAGEMGERFKRLRWERISTRS